MQLHDYFSQADFPSIFRCDSSNLNNRRPGETGVSVFPGNSLFLMFSPQNRYSFEHARAAITAMPDADLQRSLDWFGGKNTEGGVLLFIVRHAAEHPGLPMLDPLELFRPGLPSRRRRSRSRLIQEAGLNQLRSLDATEAQPCSLGLSSLNSLTSPSLDRKCGRIPAWSVLFESTVPTAGGRGGGQ